MLKSYLKRLERFLLARRSYKFSLHSWTPIQDVELAADLLRTMRFGRTLEPLVLDAPRLGRILVIAPHTDDETIGPGGSLIKAISAGAHVTVLYITTNVPEVDSRIEATEASRKAGYDIDFLGLSPSRISLDAAPLLAARITAARPDFLYIPFMLDDNNDHRRTNELLLAASRISPLNPQIEVWAYQVYGVLPMNVIVDITDVAERKADLIRCWRTQSQRRDWAHYALGMNAFNSRFLGKGPQKRFGEAFFVVPIADYVELCGHYFAAPSRAYHPSYDAKAS